MGMALVIRSEPKVDGVPEGDYLARYPWGHRALATFCALFFAALLTFFIIRAAKTSAIALSALMFAGTLYLLIEVSGTRIRFTDEGFIVRQFWFRRFSERYTDVIRVSLDPRSVRVEFADGRCVKFYPALGDQDKVIAYLEARLPESVPVEAR